MRKILVIGCGYSGERVATRHLARGDTVTAFTRDPGRGERLRAAGARVLAADLDAADPAFPTADTAYYFAPPPATGRTDPRLARALRALPPQRLVYASTTGVYGNRAGDSVDETTPPAPTTDRATRRLDAERQAEAWGERQGCPVAILRVAAIYGPARLPLQRIKTGGPVPGGNAPGNRIHVDDLAQAAIAIADHGEGGAWNVSDGNPMSIADFHDCVAAAAGLPLPRRVPGDSPELPPGVRGFLQDSRYVDNSKLLSLRGFRLAWPDPAKAILECLTGQTP